MTSNIQPGKQFNVGFQDKAESRTAIQHEVKARFRAEFINRVDEQIVFRPLSEEDARRILRPMLDAIAEELRKRHNVTLHVSEEAEQALAKAGYSPEYGVRELQRTVERLVQAPLSGVDSRWQAEGTRRLAGGARRTGPRGCSAHREDGIETDRIPTGRESPGDATSDS